jgi:hypothetical protein
MKMHQLIALTGSVIILLIELLGLNGALVSAAHMVNPAAVVSIQVDEIRAPGN